MARITPRPPATQELVLSCLNRCCPVCGGPLWFAYDNARTVTTLDAVVAVTLQVRRCVNPACAFYHRPYRPELEGRLALPHHEFGLDVIAWIGAGRYQDHSTVPEIYRALTGRGVVIAPRTVGHLLGRYEELVSVVLAAPTQRAGLYQQGRLILAVDGLQPDKGHEVLWVVREVLSGEVLLARSLLTSGRDELRLLLQAAVAGLEHLPVVGVISDGQLALRQAVADVFPDVPHQLCQFHYLREAGRPVWEADRHAQTELRKRVRGVRPIERAVEDRTDPEAEVIRGYCAAVRGALSDGGHPPLDPGGLHLQQRVAAITASLDRATAKGGACTPEPPPARVATGLGGHRTALAGVGDRAGMAGGSRPDFGQSRRRGSRDGRGPVCRAARRYAGRSGSLGDLASDGGPVYQGDRQLRPAGLHLLRHTRLTADQ
jgi:hypothetical protein